MEHPLNDEEVSDYRAETTCREWDPKTNTFITVDIETGQPLAEGEYVLDGFVYMLGYRDERGLSADDYCISADDFEPESARFLWFPFVQRGALTILAGPPKDGKSILAMRMAASVTSGYALVGGRDEDEHDPRIVVYMSGEDSVKRTLIPRAIAADAERSRLKFPKYSIELKDANGKKERTQIDLQNVLALETILKQYRPALLVVDPIQHFIGDKVDMHRANQVRGAIAPIKELAEKYDVAVILIMHLGKSGDNKGAYKILGSVDFIAAARAILMCGRDPTNGKRYMFFERGTDKKTDAAVMYTPSGVTFTYKDVPMEAAVAALGDDLEELNYEKTINKDEEDDGPDSAIGRAIAVLKGMTSGEWYRSDDLQKQAKVSPSVWFKARKRAEDEECVVLKNVPVKSEGSEKVLYWKMMRVAQSDEEEADAALAREMAEADAALAKLNARDQEEGRLILGIAS